jgi:excisionase family DNA binding protein
MEPDVTKSTKKATEQGKSPEMSDDVMTVKDVAAYLKLDERTVYNLAIKGKIPAIKIGKQWRFRRAQIDKLFGAGSV